jgi:hypothetical protein
VTPPSIPAPAQAFAPDLATGFAHRFGLIVANLVALMAHRFLRHPRFGSITITLANRLNRAVRRFQRLMTLLAANRLPTPRPPRPNRSRADQAQAPRLPAGRAWLVHAIPYEAAALACQLESLLAEPGVAELLAACPSAGGILRPIAHMLGLRIPALQPKPPRPRAPSSRRTQAASPPVPARQRPPLPPNHPCGVYRPSAQWDVPRRRRNKYA